MKPIMYELYDIKGTTHSNSSTTPIGSAFLLLFIFFIIIFVLSFNLKKTFLSRNWEENRCKYIFMSGFLQPDSSIKPHDYTLDNLKYCVKQTISYETPLFAHIKMYLNKIKYILDFLKKQIGLYQIDIKTQLHEKSTKYNDIANNRIKYLRHKQNNLEIIYNKLDKNYREINDKIETGIQYKNTLDKENEVNKSYETDRFLDYLIT